MHDFSPWSALIGEAFIGVAAALLWLGTGRVAGVSGILAGVLRPERGDISGMAQPAKVLAFLDVSGAWDASLAFVMASAVAVYACAYHLAPTRPLWADHFERTTRRDLDARLLLGAALFGVGWGAVGYCPGPSLVALSGGRAGAWVFVSAMAFGILVVSGLESMFARR